jgi:serpin B
VQSKERIRRIVLAVALVVAACDSPVDEGRPQERAFTASELAVSATNTGFGLELLREVAPSAGVPNILLSPLSVSLALGMTANGARGETYDAMRSTLGYGGLSEAALNEAYRGLIDQLRARGRNVEWQLANSVWHERTFPVEATFLDALRTNFDAEARGLDFSSADAPRTISRWAEDKTGGRIKDLIQSIDPLEIMFLVNAVYFKAPWTTPFEEGATRDGPFRLDAGGTVTARLMSGDATRPYLTDSEVEAVELLYGDSAFGMVLVRPVEGTVAELVSALTAARWQAWMSALAPGRVWLTLPKFRFDFETQLKAPLVAMGMGIAFTPLAADFGRITKARDDLYISRVVHKSFIDVHEKGTEAAAATAVGVGVTSLPPSLTFDRPFLFAIRERSSGTILFLGVLGDPTA